MKKLSIILFVLFTSVNIFSQENADYQYKVKIGDIAPDFEMSLPSGKTIKLSSLRGKVVMLQFTDRKSVV